MARLILLTKTTAPKVIDLAADRTSIGREVDNDVQILRPRVSRHHAELSVEDDGTWLRDLGSSNGTFVNGRQVQRQELHHGDVIRVGDCDIRYLTRNSSTNFGLLSELGLLC
ncbi:FHA domain-containing protein [Variovorax sp. J22G21]|uniref:FHA domain-containing protein n=1 Tax=Variovorax fucosicus TaxID=3053517 RepID=UPI0025771588|nr:MULTISPECIES: FHA domain-containing protein [unclassified Variovorax]MDM0039939.1 FHA domain-containing protein [Variovorax sp. J22R193]MDM0061312.1 FHA domain-containing protein [Variovorax sp. J22G21]